MSDAPDPDAGTNPAVPDISVEDLGRADEASHSDGMFSALSYPRYRTIWLAQIVSMLGNWAQITGRAVLVFQITGSASALGTVYFYSYIPQLLFAPVGGALADRLDRRRMLMTLQFVAAIGALLMGVLADTDMATLVNVSAVSFALGTVQTLMAPTMNALMPALIERKALASAVSIQSATANASRIFGPLVAAAAIPLFGVEVLFYANAVSFFVIIFAWAKTPVTYERLAVPQRTFAAIGEGLRVVRRSADLWVPIAMLAFISAVGLVYQPLGVAFTTDDLSGGDSVRGAFLFGVMQGALGAGAVVGVIAVNGITKRRPGDALLMSSIGFSVALVLLGATDVTGIALAISVVLGGFHFAQSTVAMNLLQHQVREELRGRVMALHMVAFIGLFPITSWIAGQTAEVIGARATLSGAGVLCLCFSLYGLRWRRHVRIDGPSPVLD